MNVVGMGTQVLECVRVRRLIDRHGETFLRQVYTDRELRFCNGRTHTTEHFTAIWAAKEAVFRSLGTTWRRGVSWTDVEVICEAGGPPRVEVSGPTRDLLPVRGVDGFLLTTAHTRAFATATALALKAEA